MPCRNKGKDAVYTLTSDSNDRNSIFQFVSVLKESSAIKYGGLVRIQHAETGNVMYDVHYGHIIKMGL